jgi:hypothetical protein
MGRLPLPWSACTCGRDCPVQWSSATSSSGRCDRSGPRALRRWLPGRADAVPEALAVRPILRPAAGRNLQIATSAKRKPDAAASVANLACLGLL